MYVLCVFVFVCP